MQENMRIKFDYSKLTRSHDQNMNLKQHNSSNLNLMMGERVLTCIKEELN